MSFEIAEESLVFTTQCAPEHDFLDVPALEESLRCLDSVVLSEVLGSICVTHGVDDSSDLSLSR